MYATISLFFYLDTILMILMKDCDLAIDNIVFSK